MSVHFAEIFSPSYLSSKVNIGDQVLKHVKGDVRLRNFFAKHLELLLAGDIEITPVKATVSIPPKSTVVRTTFHNRVEVRQAEMQVLVLFGSKVRFTEATQFSVNILEVLLNLLFDTTWLLQGDFDGLAENVRTALVHLDSTEEYAES